ncbi:Uncharacterized protein DAT39_010407, partial [Clarias magur]
MKLFSDAGIGADRMNSLCSSKFEETCPAPRHSSRSSCSAFCLPQCDYTTIDPFKCSPEIMNCAAGERCLYGTSTARK